MSEEYHDDLGRQVSDDERKLMREVLIRDENDPYEYIQVVEAGNQAGLHETRTRQIAKTWENDGVVSAAGSPHLIKLTEFGRKFAHDLTDTR